MNLSELSVKRPTLIVVIFTTFTFLGIISMRTLNYELLPKFSPPVFTVITPYPGASPVEVENSVSKRIEEVVSGLPNVDVVRCISQEGVSVVMVMLRVGAEVNPIVNEAIRKVQAVTASLPPAALEPSVTEISLDELPVLTLGVEADMPASELYDELRYRIEPQLSKIDGIGEITLVGCTEREIQVTSTIAYWITTGCPFYKSCRLFKPQTSIFQQVKLRMLPSRRSCACRQNLKSPRKSPSCTSHNCPTALWSNFAILQK